MSIRSVYFKFINSIANHSKKYIVDEHFEPIEGLNIDPYLKKSNKTALHHLLRYYWAVDFIRSQKSRAKIIDIGCGSGYGSFLLAKSLPQCEVFGCDYDKKAVKKALKVYKSPNLHFFEANLQVLKTPTDQLRFDYVVFFDTLEHLLNREIVLEKIVQIINSNGVMLLSTPCGHEDIIYSPPWPAHKIEYSYKELYKFLRRYFSDVIGADQESFEGIDVFNILNQSDVEYDHRMNPVICKSPIIINSPYESSV